MLNGLGICSGIGGLERALEPWVRWVACCEREPYPAGVLLGNTGIPIWDDLETFPWNDFKGKIDIVAAGFPCQDVSVAGNQLGMDGKRSVLVFDIIKGCGKIESKYIFLENVPAVAPIMGERIISDLAILGYDARWLCLRVPDSSPIGEGKRWFLLAQANSQRFQGGALDRSRRKIWPRPKEQSTGLSKAKILHEKTAPTLAGRTNGIPCFEQRVKALGNAVVSAQAQEAFKILSGLD